MDRPYRTRESEHLLICAQLLGPPEGDAKPSGMLASLLGSGPSNYGSSRLRGGSYFPSFLERLEPGGRIAHQHPADRHDRLAGLMPTAMAEQEAGRLLENETRNNRSRRAF